MVLHQGAQRVQTVTCNVGGREVGAFVVDAQRRIGAEVKLPAATYLEFGGTAAGEARARRDLLVNSALVGLGVVLLISVVVRNTRNLILVLLNLPFALVGGVLAVFIVGGNGSGRLCDDGRLGRGDRLDFMKLNLLKLH